MERAGCPDVGPHAVKHEACESAADSLGNAKGPEHIAIRDGKLYAAVASGNILPHEPGRVGAGVFEYRRSRAGFRLRRDGQSDRSPMR